MATKIDYTPPPPVIGPTAADEWHELLETLHESGTLRVLRGFFGQLGRVADVALTELQSEKGKNTLGSILLLLELLAKIPADDLKAMSTGLEKAAPKAKRMAEQKPPGTLKLLRLLRQPDTRRFLGTMLVLANGMGAELGKPKRPGGQA